jgi:hypothetical protein
MNKKLATLFFLSFIGSVFADDYNRWKEPELAPISPTGTVIAVENTQCTVTGPRSIQCLNIGRFCVAKRKADDEEGAKTFGCALENSPNHPCKPWKQLSEEETRQWAYCLPTTLGGW